jgi:hypothetical protein
MTAAKSLALTNSIRFVLSLTHGILLVFLYLFFYLLQGEGVYPSFWILLATMPFASYAIGFALNALVQYLSCSSVNAIQIALDSLFGPIFTTMILVITWFFPSLTSPVLSVLPETLTPFYQKAVSEGFYLFWGGLYAQALSAGYAQSCPS